ATEALTSMPRDCKHARRRSGGSTALTGTAGFVLGLALGLSVAVGVYLFDRRPEANLAREAPPIASEEPKEQAESPARETGPQFDFYEMLPKFEVVIPEQEGTVTSANQGARVS